MLPGIQISDYNYTLPENRIAKYPLSDRESSKLLVYNKGHISERVFRELPEIVERDTLLVFNDTRVVQSRLKFTKSTGSKIEVFCLEPDRPADYNLAFQCTEGSTWKCLVGNAKKWKEGCLEMELTVGGRDVRLRADKRDRVKDAFIIRFDWEPSGISFGAILEEAGSTPIPPYLNREAEELDRSTYQTVYSQQEGSVAAPTAGLHFTDEVLDNIAARKIKKLDLTLHVGAGTFQPVIAKDISDHPMHAEHFFISRSVLESLLSHGGRILAIGTTSTRVLESLFWLGAGMTLNKHDRNPVFLDQWDAYSLPVIEKEKSLESLLAHMDRHGLEALEGLTRLMITPGYKYRVVNQLLTNYHQPKSTLLLLVAAMIGEDWRKVYRFALENGFRFLSYGDSSLLIP